MSEEKVEASAYARIVELIAEMSWGVDLPSPMMVHFQETILPLGADPCDPRTAYKPQEVHAVCPKNYEVVFEAIRRKLMLAPEYQPYKELQDKLKKAEEELAQIKEQKV